MRPDKAEIILTVKDVFMGDLGVRIGDNDQDFFQELAVDSLAFLNAIARIEKIYHVRFVNEDVPLLSSCNKVAESILDCLEKAA